MPELLVRLISVSRLFLAPVAIGVALYSAFLYLLEFARWPFRTMLLSAALLQFALVVDTFIASEGRRLPKIEGLVVAWLVFYAYAIIRQRRRGGWPWKADETAVDDEARRQVEPATSE